LTIDHSPTIEGFEWSSTTPYVPTEPDEDGWCVRNAISELLLWEPGGEEWRRFIEGPGWPDTRRLTEHLGLTPLEFPQDWNNLLTCLNHPGVATFAFPDFEKSHEIYVHDIRWLLHYWPIPCAPHAEETSERHLVSYGWPLFPHYVDRGPVLCAVIIDERQAPRPE
jgi:hypothetical protein